MTRDDVERVWQERLQRCQRQLKAKEDEMCRQSRYFDSFKAQLQHKLGQARDREESLQKRIYALEKQLLDVAVSVATDAGTLSAVRITAKTETRWQQHERLPGARGEGEGEEEKNGGRRHPNLGAERDGTHEDKPEQEKVRLQGFIVNLQEDLRVLLERQESGVTERRRLMEQLQEAQENSQLLCCEVEEMKVEIQQLKLSESILIKEVEDLQRDLQGSTKQTPCHLTTTFADVCSVPSSAHTTGHHSQGSSEKVLDDQDAVPVVQHQVAAGSPKSGASAPILTAKCGSQHSSKMDSFPRLSLQSLDVWGSTRCFNLEETHSEESDALREAYRSLGLGEDLEGLREQYDHLEAALQHSKEQLQVMAEENDQLKFLLRSQAEAKQMPEMSTTSSPVQNDITHSDLLQALNRENRALAVRIQELLDHIELNDEEIKSERSQLRKHILCLEEDRAKLEQEKEEHGCLITELTRKTEDDLNTIMELQQKLEDERLEWSEQKNVQCGSTCTVLGRCQEKKPTECSVQSVATEELPQLVSSQQVDITACLKPACQHNNLSSLKVEQEELTSSVLSLKKEQEEVSLSVQAQTEEKQHLTRAVWALKEEKDKLSRSLHGLKQEREHLIRAVSGVKDEKARLFQSVSELKEAKDKLTECFPALEREKEKLLESLSSGKEEANHIAQSVEHLQREKEQLSQSVLTLTVETCKLSDSLKRLKEQTDQAHPSRHLQQDGDGLLKSISRLKEEKDRSEHSVRCLKLEEAQIMQSLQALREERNSQRSQMREKQSNHAVTGEEKGQNATGSFNGKNMQEQRELLREIEDLTAELKKSQEELQKRRVETADLHRQLSQSEAWRQDAERKAAQAVDEVKRMTDLITQTEELSMANGHLTTQVTALQSKVDLLAREKAATLSLKADIEDQYSILTAQLKAKTVALEELNAEYITLKNGRGNKDDLSALMSLRTRYNDIQAKYDALLKTRIPTDVDVVPLKAKLSSLVLKCQERNNLLAQMMRALRGHGPVDPTLTQQVDQLLNDAALLQYTTAFTQTSFTKGLDRGLTAGFISNFQKYTWSAEAGGQQNQNEFHTEQKTRHHSSSEAWTTTLPDCSGDAMPAPAVIRKKNDISPVPTLQEDNTVPSSPEPKLKEVFSLDTPQLLPSDEEPEKMSPLDKRPESSSPCSFNMPDPSGSRRSPAPPLSVSCVRRRLSSPEKILNLQEQLQQALLSFSQASVSRGRGEQSRRSFSFSAPASPSPSAQTKLQAVRTTAPPSGPLPFSTASSLAKPPPALSTTPVARNQPTTLFNAVTARSANRTFTPHSLSNHRFKAAVLSTTSTPSLSAHSFISNATSSKAKSTTSSDTNVPAPLNLNSAADVANADHTSSLTTAIFKATNANDFTASDTTAITNETAHKADDVSAASKPDGAASARDRLEMTTFHTQLLQHSPERRTKSAARSHSAPEKMRPSRPKAEAPAEVRSVEVIKQVGQSSLLIGWERPPLDELGCSHGTFVYGYRVFVDGEFYKSVMSSACTKCVLENVDLTEPVEIGVQTLGSNGLISTSVHAMYVSPGP
ncbi:myosin-3 isoform X2 [Dunckerocampus dactyliophorus]|uniref:myosin-3 isoform X2 n=1 Tax=Dunckerocampus dactyliophorus TaxID=161453 RepID=UPI002404B217|nr:myosin-3 isoform X2 [Dunckerocampus dactyliophorus]